MEEDSEGEATAEEDQEWMKSLPPVDQLLDDCSSSGAGSSSKKQEKADSHISRMELNTNKAGMDGLDKEKINKIIMGASMGSRFYENEQKRDKQVNQRIEKLLQMKSKVTDFELKAAKAKVDKLIKELERGRDLSRTIVHIDMDMFYAAVEMLEKPELRTKPMAVGGIHMLSTSNYVARRYGVRAGMPGFIALKLCPNLVMVETNFAKYREYSAQVREILAEYDPNFSVMSLDEAYLDFTDHMEKRQFMCDKERTFVKLVEVIDFRDDGGGKPSDMSEEGNKASGIKTDEKNLKEKVEDSDCLESAHEELTVKQSTGVAPSDASEWMSGILSTGQESEEKSPSKGQPVLFGKSVEDAVNEMRFRIHQKTKLTASAGIAPNCMLAKIASDMNKPNGQFMIKPTREDVLNFITDLPVRKVSGIGKVMEKLLSALGVKICSDLYRERALLYKLFTPISFNHFIRISRGLGSTEVGGGEERKSISTERTFGNKSKPEDLLRICQELCESLATDVERKGIKGKVVTLKLKTVQFELKNRSLSVMSGISTGQELFNVARDLLQSEIRACKPRPLALRLMGVRLSSFLSEEEVQGSQKQQSLMSFMKKSSSKSKGKPSLEAGAKTSENSEVAAQSKPSQKADTEKEETIEAGGSREAVTRQESELQDSKAREIEAREREIEEFDEDEDRVVSGRHKYACPVCSKETEYRNLEEFNQHVDECLNKGAISSIMKDNTSRQKPASHTGKTTTLKRSSNGSSSSSKKKMKTKQGRKFSTLDKFFTKHS